MKLTDQDIDKLLHQAPVLRPPDGLLKQLDASISLPNTGTTIPMQGRGFWRSWMSIAAIWVLVIGVAAAITVQQQKLQKAQQRLEEMRRSANELESLRSQNADLKPLEIQVKALERLKQKSNELNNLRQKSSDYRRRQAEVPQLQAKIQAINQERVKRGGGVNSPQAQKACVGNLKQINSAKEQWGLENRKPITAVPLPKDLYGTNEFIKHEPKCPLGGIYTLHALSERPTCSITDHVLDDASLFSASPEELVADPNEKPGHKCVNNLKIVAIAAKVTAQDSGAPYLPNTFEELGHFLVSDKTVLCPEFNTKYVMVSPGMKDIHPLQIYVRCDGHQNYAFGDGHVEHLDAEGLKKYQALQIKNYERSR